MKSILSAANPYIKELACLHQKKGRSEKGQFLVEGYHLVEEAKKAQLLQTVFILAEEQAIPGITNILVSQAVLDKLTKTKEPQPIVGLCRIPAYEMTKGNRFLLLDDIQDPGNMGTLFRSAFGFGIDWVIVSPNCVDLYNDKVIRATQGAIFHQKHIEMDLSEALIALKSKNIPVFGTALDQATNLAAIKPPHQYGLLLGNEGSGVHPWYLASCDQVVRIETNPNLESLNVGVAGSILMYYFFKEKGE
ncbi:MAG: RNA methyltransferase [Bacilli bacterium]|jgi:TrmH family RNA methyltransferase|nr:RNA methyltransferase [Bacilli bacterium]